MNVAAFDALAGDYDRAFTHSLVGAAQRRQVWDTLDACLQRRAGRQSVLELNCGTGEDAVHMARAGHRVLATDVSGAMLRVTQVKLARAGLQQGVGTQRLDLQDLAHGRAAPEALGGPFDLVFSNFGGLNCIDAASLRALAAPLAASLVPGGLAVLVLMPRLCLWESLWALAHLRPRQAWRRRQRAAVMAQLAPGEPGLPVWYHDAADVRRALASHFDCEQVRPIGLAVPPSALEPLARRVPRLLALAERLDRRWLTAAWGARLSDHVLVQLRRR